MGGCFGKEKIIDPPNIVTKIEVEELTEIISKSLGVDPNLIYLPDKEYGLYSLDDLKRFLDNDSSDKLDYIIDGFDCDDFADVLKGKERIWYKSGKNDCGSTFGIIWGDLRTEDQINEERPHAVNYIVDDKKELWLIEPQNDSLFKLTKNSTVSVTFG